VRYRLGDVRTDTVPSKISYCFRKLRLFLIVCP
jgi:hypothetical protein